MSQHLKEPNVTYFQFLFTEQTFPWNKKYMEVLSEVTSTFLFSV